MSTALRIATACAVAALAVPLSAAPASADTVSEPPASAAYFNSRGVAKPDAAPAAPPNPIASVDGVAPENIAVASQASAEDKVSFLFFSLTTVPVGSTINKATLTVPLVPNGNGNVSVNQAPERVAACKIIGSGFSTEDGESLALAPERKCDEFQVPGTATEDGLAYVFDLTGLATTWMEVNDGLALTRNKDANANFQVVFSRAATLDVDFTPPPATADTTAPVDSSTTVPLDTGSTGGSDTSSVPSFDSGSGSGSAAVSGGGFAALETPALPPTAAGPAPTTAEAPAIATVNRAAPRSLESLSPTTGLFVVGLLLAAALAFLSLVMGDPRAAAPVAVKATRLSRALASRTPGTSLLSGRS